MSVELNHLGASRSEELRLFFHADELAWAVAGTTSPNPAVGCLLLDDTGRIIGQGATQPAGGAHAEVMALADAQTHGEDVRGSRAVVTLEPCNHTGRTGPCSHALAEAGVARVDYLFADPNPQAQGGADYLRAHGVEVNGPALSPTHKEDEPPTQWVPIFAVETWLTSAVHLRPHVTLKLASTIDGFIAATDGTSQWITGEAARRYVHEDRARRDAIVVGTGTVAADNPRLTARDESGQPMPQQPLRVVMGRRSIPDDAAIHHPPGQALHLREHNPRVVLQEMHSRGMVDVLVEGGPHITTAFLDAGVVDRIELYQAPSLLRAGQPSMIAPVNLSTSMSDIRELNPRQMRVLGRDTLWTLSR